MRVQLSLQFTDKVLFDEFIEPYRKNRELTPLIMKMLNAYCYSDEIRTQIEMYSQGYDISNKDEMNSVLRDASSQSDFEDAMESARKTLAIMNALTEQADMSMEVGMEDILEKVDIFGEVSRRQDKEVTASKQEFSESTDSTNNVSIDDLVSSLGDSGLGNTGFSQGHFEEPKPDALREPINSSEVSKLVEGIVSSKMSSLEERLISNETTLTGISGVLMRLEALLSSGVVRAATTVSVSESTEIKEQVQPTPAADTSVTSERGSSDVLEAEPVASSDVEPFVEESSTEVEDVVNLDETDNIDDEFVSDAEDSDDTDVDSVEDGFSALNDFLNNGVGFFEDI